MNPEIKKLWLEALRSGLYQQGRGALRPTTSTFCCLGVLCDLFSQANAVPWKFVNGLWLFLRQPGHLPNPVRAWAGIGPIALTVPAARKNDDGATFEQIAEFLETLKEPYEPPSKSPVD